MTHNVNVYTVYTSYIKMTYYLKIFIFSWCNRCVPNKFVINLLAQKMYRFQVEKSVQLTNTGEKERTRGMETESERVKQKNLYFIEHSLVGDNIVIITLYGRIIM